MILGAGNKQNAAPQQVPVTKLMTIVALAITLISASTFAASAAAVFEDAQHGAGEASQR